MLRVGLTGGIGSGKSTIAGIFMVMGIPIYDADSRAKKIMNENEALKQSLIEEFGPEVYTPAGLNRSFLAQIVFSNPERLQVLNHLVHPHTIQDAETWMHQQESPYAIKEAALIFESGAQSHLDIVIGVTAPLALRIKRTMHRDKTTREAVMERMSRQINDVIKMRLCDYVIVNDDRSPVIPQVLRIHAELIKRAQAV
ncbi:MULTISPECIES: dephospho-CoA kinase [unclassified Paraflavitalea]|uniref:dephospho-CoA kinase n=1 Tax=unclassified Paraflavitalea TaxID=2798305 RepID=UPI003D34FF23